MLLTRSGYASVTAATGDDALDIAIAQEPLVVLTETHVPGLNGYELCRVLRDAFGLGVAIAFVSGTRNEKPDVSAGLLVGADDYLVKPCDPGELVARAGGLLRRVVMRGSQPGTHMERPLTARESEILGLLARGLTQREIAATLLISANTVGHHIEHVISKLGVHSRTQAVAAGYRSGLVPVPPSVDGQAMSIQPRTPSGDRCIRYHLAAALLRARPCGDRSAGRSGCRPSRLAPPRSCPSGRGAVKADRSPRSAHVVGVRRRYPIQRRAGWRNSRNRVCWPTMSSSSFGMRSRRSSLALPTPVGPVRPDRPSAFREGASPAAEPRVVRDGGGVGRRAGLPIARAKEERLLGLWEHGHGSLGARPASGAVAACPLARDRRDPDAPRLDEGCRGRCLAAPAVRVGALAGSPGRGQPPIRRRRLTDEISRLGRS